MSVETHDARIECDSCGAWIWTRKHPDKPPALPSTCPRCGADTPKETRR